MTSREFAEWRAYYDVEPFGWERVDVAVAQHSQLVANMSRKKGSTPYKLKDFIVRYERKKKGGGGKHDMTVQPARQMLSMFRSRAHSLKRAHPNRVTITESPPEIRRAREERKQARRLERAEGRSQVDPSGGEEAGT